jgi:hypothetical protein
LEWLAQLVQPVPRVHEVHKVQVAAQVRQGLQVRPERQLLLSPWLLAIPIAVLEE